MAVKMSENKQLIERLAKASDVKYKKAKLLIQTLEEYVDLPNFPEECTYTFSHTREWCGVVIHFVGSHNDSAISST